MSEYIESCMYCNAKVKLDTVQRYVRCKSCGNIMAITSFSSVQMRYEQEIEKKEKLQKDLESAEQEKEDLRNRMQQGFSSLEALAGDSHANTELLNQIIEKGEASKDALTNLLTQIRGDQKSGQNAITDILIAVAEKQNDNNDKIDALENTARNILQYHNDTDQLLQTVLQQLGRHTANFNELKKELIRWSQEAHTKDLERLKQILSASHELIQGQQAIERHIQTCANKIDSQLNLISAKLDRQEMNRIHEQAETYHQAQLRQFERRFDEAENLYQRVLTLGGHDVEVYWRILLCHYCVEYQKNDKEDWIPTILYPDLSNPENVPARKELLDHLINQEDQDYYHTRLKKIEDTLDKYRQVRYEMAYDVFISVKQTDDQGHYTDDSDIASDLYDHIKNLGLKVFNSRREDLPAGKDYEPYIMAALLSSKVMIVVGTQPEYMNSQWVRNEWSRFQWLRKNEPRISGRSERLLLCYIKFDVKTQRLPDGLNPTQQAIRADAVDTKGILYKALSPYLHQPPTPPAHKVVSNPSTSVARQMKALLSINNFDDVLKKYKDITQNEELLVLLEQPFIHLYALCATLKIRSVDQLASTELDLKQDPFFQNAQDVAVASQDKELLQKLLEQNQANRKKASSPPTPVPVQKPVPTPEKEPEKVPVRAPEKAQITENKRVEDRPVQYLTDKCIYCRNIIRYEAGAKFAKCNMCGQIIPITRWPDNSRSFESAMKDAKQAEESLKEATKQRVLETPVNFRDQLATVMKQRSLRQAELEKLDSDNQIRNELLQSIGAPLIPKEYGDYDVYIRTDDRVSFSEAFRQVGIRSLQISGRDSRELSNDRKALLDSMRVMILVASMPAKLNTPSIRNEWMYFLQLQPNVRSSKGRIDRKLIVYLIDGMSAATVPGELAKCPIVLEGNYEKLYKELLEVFRN